MIVSLPDTPFVTPNLGATLPPPTAPRPTLPPGYRHRKIPDLCGHAYTTFTMLREDDLFFAQIGDLRSETPLVTAHTIRGTSTQCRHHAGTMVMGSDGYCRPAMCYNEGQKPFGDPAAAIGEMFIATADHDVKAMRMHRGYAYGVLPVQNPATFIAVWNGTPGSGLPG